MNPQPQSDMMDYSMCGRTQDPRPFQQVNERVKDTAKTPYCQKAEETIEDLFNKVMGAIHPEVLATIKAEGVHSDDFTMDNINIESWQTDNSLSRSRALASSSNCYSAMKKKIRIRNMDFANFAETQRAAATRVIHCNYLPLANDGRFPQDQAARTFYIRRLYEAFTDITQCIDSATVANFDLRWATLSSSTSPYTPAMITTICHALLSIANNLHTQGPISLNVFDKGKLENVYKFRDLTFGARVDKVCELMRISKTR
ncbi:hypothetical protein BKA58DRAFT_434259 [Alternaria rosae]|uniref:uncharacterized protein n=1 Tax=Alternaria rosae TaxID=1187941 RepID=UPI001E8E01DC|nr:uncharacterized protein BKA58DRAFT_434259 [Alternaria rosae]KAH6882499.1 hypothetical protein BKA58DRAFT_434259 [Alternaria rosae]